MRERRRERRGMVAYGIGSELSDEVPPASVGGARAKKDEAIDRRREPGPHLCEGHSRVSAQERSGLACERERGEGDGGSGTVCVCVCRVMCVAHTSGQWRSCRSHSGSASHLYATHDDAPKHAVCTSSISTPRDLHHMRQRARGSVSHPPLCSATSARREYHRKRRRSCS